MPKVWIKTAGRSTPSPVPHRSWMDAVDEFDVNLIAAAEAATEAEVVDSWLENPMEFRDADAPAAVSSSAIRRVASGGGGLRRSDSMGKQASTSGWDQDLADAKKHAASVLANLGR